MSERALERRKQRSMYVSTRGSDGKKRVVRVYLFGLGGAQVVKYQPVAAEPGEDDTVASETAQPR